MKDAFTIFMCVVLLSIGCAVGITIRDIQNEDLPGYNQNPSNVLDAMICTQHVDYSIALILMHEEEDIVRFHWRIEEAIKCIESQFVVLATKPVENPRTGVVDQIQIVYAERVDDTN